MGRSYETREWRICVEGDPPFGNAHMGSSKSVLDAPTFSLAKRSGWMHPRRKGSPTMVSLMKLILFFFWRDKRKQRLSGRPLCPCCCGCLSLPFLRRAKSLDQAPISGESLSSLAQAETG